jgi:predicted phage tail protein
VTTVVADVGTSSGASNLAVAAALGKYGPYVVPNAPAGTYYMRLRAVSAAGSSVASNEVFVTVGGGGGGGTGGAPPPPTGLRATVNAGRVVTLVWYVNENGADTGGYTLEVGSQSGLSDYGAVRVQTQGMSAGPVPPGVYYLRVRAWNDRGTSPPGSEVRLVVP